MVDKAKTEDQAPDVSESSSSDAPFYCPGCGKRAGYQRTCEGTATAPHPPIEVVSTDELAGDPEGHTPAPAGGELV